MSSTIILPENPASRSAQMIVQRLQKHGYTAYFAGGCVRDLLLDLNPADYDIATNALPEQISSLFEHTEEVGKSFGVMLVKLKGFSFEVATFRTDHSYSDGRHPDSVSFTTPEADAQRRDFTINALFLDPADGQIYDFVDGMKDLKASFIRAVGDPESRFAEDHLRMLRAIRFSARYNFEIHPATTAAIRANAESLSKISRERVSAEVNLICAGKRPGTALALLNTHGLWPYVFGNDIEPLSQEISFALNETSPLPEALVYASLLYQSGEDTDKLAHRVLLSKKLIRSITGFLECIRKIMSWDSLSWIERRHLLAADGFKLSYKLLGTTSLLEHSTPHIECFLRETPSPFELPDPLVSGTDVLNAGLPAGPRVAKILKSLYDMQLQDPELSKLDLLGNIESVAQSLDHQ